ncbi:MAG: IS4 family transposase [Planctomycetaceae bacterium]|nr:IS4 family transposase [Planctomycetaceae bacterium]MBV8315344.1 IS4 family transposase [Planctomycetaceae bacterium]
MSIIGQVALSLQTALGAALDAIGRRTGVIQRQRKFSGSTLFKTLVLTVLKSPNPKTDDIVATAAQLGVTVTSEAVEKRFTPRLITFLRAGLEHLLEHTVAADPVAIPLLERFTAVEIGDSTTVTVPDDYADEFPGCGGKADSGQAAVKIQVRWELRTGKLTKLLVEPGRHSDAASEAAEDPVTPGSLVIRDLGYFSLERFRELDAAGAYWISRWQPGTAVFDLEGRPLELLEYVRRHSGNGPLDRPILLGSAERLSCRLIVLRVPQEVADRRRQKAYEKAQKHGRVPSQEHLAWCDWTLLVTNCPADLLTWKEVVVLYRARWQIELLFKLWKSHNHLAASRETWSAVERMALFWAKLIGVVLQHWLLLTSTWSNPRRSHWKAAGVIRQWIVSLTAALDDLGALIEVLASLTRTIHAVAHKKRQRKSPSSFQLLLNPDLLNWNC